MTESKSGPLLICTNCGAKVNPLRVRQDGMIYKCINCGLDRNDGPRGSASSAIKSDNSPLVGSQSFKNQNRGNKNKKKKKI